MSWACNVDIWSQDCGGGIWGQERSTGVTNKNYRVDIWRRRQWWYNSGGFASEVESSFLFLAAGFTSEAESFFAFLRVLHQTQN
eukprot:1745044-Ditylum_brightwellii.AAC.1